jgi:hypothetical protein
MVASDFAVSMHAAAMLISVPLDFSEGKSSEKESNSGWGRPYESQLRADLDFLKDESSSAVDFLNLPLWTIEASSVWIAARSRFEKELRYVGNGFDIWRDWYIGFLNGWSIDVDLIRRAYAVPSEVEALGAKAINSYVLALGNNSAIRPLNRVRAIFIGYGEAGKTSLIRVLHNEAVPEGREPMTPGIDIREWRVPNTDINAHFWDFGGQVMVHATHQLFLRSSCLYVLVISARAEINASEQAEYWLEHVKSFGRGAPVMIVGNRIDQADLNLDMGMLTEKYPNIVGYYPLSCTQAHGAYLSHANAFREAFSHQLLALSTHQVMFTQSQFEVLQNLRKLTLSQSFLPKTDFELLCEKHGIGENATQGRRWLLDILDKLGVIIHFPQLPFADGYVLNPRWLTYGVYTLMYAKKARLEIEDVIRILSQEKVKDEAGNELSYPAEKCRLVMDAMHEFKLSYPLKGNAKAIIIPALLPAEQLQFPFKKDLALAFEFSFEVFLPRHIMPELIVNRHQEIFEERVWQTGVHLKSATLNADSLIFVDYHARKLFLWILGPDAKDYLTIVRDDLYSILRRIDVEYKELVTLPEDARLSGALNVRPFAEKASYRQILALAARGQTEFTSESGETYDISKILRHFVTPAKQRSDISQYFNFYAPVDKMESNMNDKKVIVNKSTVHGGVTAADNIVNSFNAQNGFAEISDLKKLVSELASRVEELKANAPVAIEADVREIVADTQLLKAEVDSENPNEPRILRRLSGILGAAKTVGEIGKSVLESASAINDLFS